MSLMNTNLSVFTKPWKTMPITLLGELVSRLGFSGIELPLRDGFQVNPAEAVEKLPIAAAELARYNLAITSVAGSTDETTFAACQLAGIPLIRIMLQADLEKGYLRCEQEWLQRLDKLKPLCEKYQVRIGIQNHYGPGVFATMELRHLLEQCHHESIGAIWDSAHSGLAGEAPEQALDIISEYLLLVNLKAAYYEKKRDPETNAIFFKPCFTTGQDGACSWPRIIRYLKKINYAGPLCMPAEYTDEANVLSNISQDITYLKQLLDA